MSNTTAAFKEWYDAVWEGSEMMPVPSPQQARQYSQYMDGYTLAHGAWNKQQSTIDALQARIDLLEAAEVGARIAFHDVVEQKHEAEKRRKQLEATIAEQQGIICRLRAAIAKENSNVDR